MMLLALLGLVGFAQGGSNYAVLIAGSHEYYNYRHQSDVCHAYQILTKLGGFPPENIITMMYDDIAYNSENPVKGNIINKPNGPNVYTGVQIDYKGAEVTAQNFLNVLTGKSTVPGKKVLNSTAEDDVFVYFADHGAPGLIAMPTGNPLYAKDLMSAFKEMESKKMYKQLVIYVEACESGSMFDGILPRDMNIFATTAANPNESSYAWYFDEKRDTYLGDEYSIHWMEDSDRNKLTTETLERQFERVKFETTKSHPQQYGDRKMEREPLDDFQGFDKQEEMIRLRRLEQEPSALYCDSRDIKLCVLKRKAAKAETQELASLYGALVEKEEEHRKQTDIRFLEISTDVSKAEDPQLYLTKYTPPRDFKCLKGAYSLYESICESFTDYSLKYVRTLVSLCEEYGTERVVSGIAHACA